MWVAMTLLWRWKKTYILRVEHRMQHECLCTIRYTFQILHQEYLISFVNANDICFATQPQRLSTSYQWFWNDREIISVKNTYSFMDKSSMQLQNKWYYVLDNKYSIHSFKCIMLLLKLSPHKNLKMYQLPFSF